VNKTNVPQATVSVVDAHLPRAGNKARTLTEVAVGILINPAGEFLLTTRPAGKVYAGYWEFPGGKLETNETVTEALKRELHEEIGINITHTEIWRESIIDYPHALVRLHFCKVRHWTGKLHMREGQSCAWQTLPVTVSPVLAGAIPVLEWLADEGSEGKG